MTEPLALVLHGHVIDALGSLPEKSIHACVTSPPYFGLREYKGAVEQDWDGWVGHLGGEPTFTKYIENMVLVMREVRRVLRDDGVVALNIGDCYSASRSYQVPDNKHRDVGNARGMKATEQGVQEKCKLLIPHRLAIALIDDGWICRQDNVWSKQNGLPESVTDRPSTSHEYVFLLAKSQDYYWDHLAVREPSKGATGKAASFKRTTKEDTVPGQLNLQHREDREDREDNGFRNMRSVIHIAAEPLGAIKTGKGEKESHFAAFPTALIRPFILAGCPEKCCPTCGKGWVREVEKERVGENRVHTHERPAADERGVSETSLLRSNGRTGTRVTTIGWKQSCKCEPAPPVPGVTLDPFGGTGTTGIVALRHERRAILCELSAPYLKIIKARLTPEIGLFHTGGIEVRKIEGSHATPNLG